MSSWEAYQRTMIAPATLWSAAKDGDVETLARLLDEGHDIDARDPRGYSPLMLATYAGHAGAFELLLARGADRESADAAGNTVLMGAAFKGHAAMVERLLSAGARADARNGNGLSAWDFAELFGRADVLAIFARQPGAPL